MFQDLNIHIHRQWVPAHEREQHTQVLHLQYHGREIHTVCFISFPQQSKLEKPCDSLIATGCEDGTVRLTRLEKIVRFISEKKSMAFFDLLLSENVCICLLS